MIKVAVLDDYQSAFEEIVDIEKFKNKFDFKIFNEAFNDENEAIEALEEFEALFIMRERTPITKNLLENLPNLKYIMTSGMRNNSINLEVTKKKGVLVCGTEINPNPAAEITWTLILGLLRNVKQEIDNMFQGYWQTTIGTELKGKMLGVIGLGKIGTQVAKVGKAFGMEVCAWSENLNLSHANELGVLPMSKEDLLKNSDILTRCFPSIKIFTAPSGNFKTCRTLAITPTLKILFSPGLSSPASRCATRSICCSVFITSSKAKTDFSRPTKSRTIMFGKTTMSLRGKTGIGDLNALIISSNIFRVPLRQP